MLALNYLWKGCCKVVIVDQRRVFNEVGQVSMWWHKSGSLRLENLSVFPDSGCALNALCLRPISS